MNQVNIHTQVSSRKALDDFVTKCKLEFPEEVAQLFENYTRVIWQHKCPGKIHKFYCDETVCYGEGGRKTIGTDEIVAGTLGFMRSFPERICDFVDIFAEGNEEEGYSFGQATRFNAVNTGYSKFGPPTGKSLQRDGEYCHSICECRVKKVEGRWRIIEEWVIESAEAINETLQFDPRENLK
ncbi:MAG: hypothetical protein K0S71_2274 [Clostridia bacterium]|jgi:hypothetical protein|nr:hypothetical protein [Clostridia bacterium]